MKGHVKGYCKDCKYFMNNFEIEENDITDYEDVVCTYHMSDGFGSWDYCSKFKEKDKEDGKMKSMLVLVTNTLTECDGCPCLNYKMWYCQADKKHRDAGDDTIPDWCPLKPLEENYISIDWLKNNIIFRNEKDRNYWLNILDVWRERE